jgi:hypothetical protein
MSNYIVEKYAEFLSSEDLINLFRYLEKEYGSVLKAASACGIETKTYYDWRDTHYLKLPTKRKVLKAALEKNPDETLEFVMKRLMEANRELFFVHVSTVYEMAAKEMDSQKLASLLRRFDSLRQEYASLTVNHLEGEIGDFCSHLVSHAADIGLEWYPEPMQFVATRKLEQIMPILKEEMNNITDASEIPNMSTRLGVPLPILSIIFEYQQRSETLPVKIVNPPFATYQILGQALQNYAQANYAQSSGTLFPLLEERTKEQPSGLPSIQTLPIAATAPSG